MRDILNPCIAFIVYVQAVCNILNPDTAYSVYVQPERDATSPKAKGTEAARGAVGAQGLHSYTDRLNTRVYYMLHVYGIQSVRTGCA